MRFVLDRLAERARDQALHRQADWVADRVLWSLAAGLVAGGLLILWWHWTTRPGRTS